MVIGNPILIGGGNNGFTPSDEGKVVSNGALVAQGSQTINQNGTYDTTLVSELIANISGGGSGAKNILGGTTDPTSADGSDGDIYIKYSDYSGISSPSGYTRVEYIKSDGYQYINTGYVPNDNTFLVLDMNVDPSNSTYSAIVGTLGTPYLFIITHISGTPNLTVAWGGDHRLGFNVVGQRVIVKFKKGEIIVQNTDGTELCNTAFSASSNTYSSSLYLFTAYGTTRDRTAAGKIYSSKIYENNTLLYDFVPVKRKSDNVLGVYDLVNDVFYTNAGTGSFTAGAELKGTPIDTVYLKVGGSWIIIEDGEWDDVKKM